MAHELVEFEFLIPTWKAGVAACACNSSPGEAERDISMQLTGQPTQTNQSGSVRDPVSESRVEG